ncbi:MAG TPA: ABC transporter ATP-binding protein [Candidatus Limnocylindrales bacterium]
MSFGRGRGTRGLRMAAGGTGARGGHGFGMAQPVVPVPPERRGTTIRRIVAFFRPYRLRVGTVAVAILVTSLVGLVNPFLLRLLIDDVFTAGHFQNLNLYVGLMIVLPIANGLIGLGQTYLSNSVGQHVMQDLRDALYVQLQRMPLRFFTETRTGEIQSRLANDVGGVQSVVTDTATSVLANAATIISTVVAMVLIDWRLTLLSLGLMPFFLYLTYRVGKVRRTVSTDVQEALADMSAINEETLSVSGMLLTKTFGQQQAATDRFRKVNVRLGILQLRQSMVGRWFFMIVGTVFSITPALVYWVAGLLHGAPDAPTVGDIVAFTTLQSRLFFPLGQMLSVQVEVQGALALFDRIFEYLDMEPEIVDAPDAVRPDPETVRGHVRYAHVSFRYPSAAPVVAASEAELDVEQASPAATVGGPPEPFALEDIDFEMKPGQLVALVGPSGSGKTTTTYLLPRLYDVNDGAVRIDGTDVRQIALASLGRIIGVVTQETYLFHASIRDNLRYAQAEASDTQLEVAARAAAIHDRIMELPDGYDTLVGERGYKLSGGEKQRIAIARVLLKDPRILILDEATSALDTVSERLIQAALDRAMAGRTTLAIAHRLSTILAADLILVYQRGRIVERGTHRQLLAHGGLYAQLYHEQFLSAAAQKDDGRGTATEAAGAVA